MTKRPSLPHRLVVHSTVTALIAAPFAAVIATPAYAADATTPIHEIQGTSETSPLLNATVTTRGVVTASYPTGNFNGFVIQTPGSGDEPRSDGASEAVFVYKGNNSGIPAVGTYVEVTGKVTEYNGLTQIQNPTITTLSDEVDAPQPLTIAWPTTEAARESIEAMLYAPTGKFTVTNTYSTNNYGEVGLAYGDTPLLQPTDVARPGSAEATAVETDNAARAVTLDDGATFDFLSGSNRSLLPTYISLDNPVRVGADVTFSEPVIVDYRNNAWKLNPTRYTPAGQEVVSFKDTRTDKPDQEKLAGAAFTIASFNVLNYFTTGGNANCTSYKDRSQNPITVNSCPDSGPRGAWDEANLKRQQDKLVAAINGLDASVVGLLEIENSAVLGESLDEATATLVDALNAAAETDKWAYIPSSSQLPSTSQQDVITNAIIYQPLEVEPLGDSVALGSLSGSGQTFSNAREPIGQAFSPKDGSDPVFVTVNHFKSKGSAGPLPGDSDSGDGQGASNASRVAQAEALAAWVPQALEGIEESTGTEVASVALVGDFNAYGEEDPIIALEEAGYTDATKALNSGEYSYSYSGLSGSLDHVLYNDDLKERVTGSDIWNINAPESIALEYSRYNYHGALYYAPDAYRSSDHDPVIIGVAGQDASELTEINILDINDFHGRIDSNTVKFAGTIEKLRKDAGEDNTLFVSSGDNIGASLFESAIAHDTPTLDVLNALDLAVSAVGNHEFDQGLSDLQGRVKDEANFNYLGANVYEKGSTNPVFKEYETFDVSGVTVGLIGAITQETPTLVTPSGIADIDFGDPVAAVNRVADQLTDGDANNGEADVLIALYHEGAGAGTPDGATLNDEIAAGGAFADIVTKTDAAVDAIFTGHTHKQYAWLAANDEKSQRPVVQTGSYGENIGHVVLKVDPETKDVVSAEAQNIARTTQSDEELIAEFPRVAEVSEIVGNAIANAREIGQQPIAQVTADITTAFANGAFVDGTYTGGSRDHRAESSSLATLVADSLKETLADPARGGADIGVVNPGGLRAELLKDSDGVITYAEANAVLPFTNNLWTTQLTGAQVKTMLEQQWQRDDKGNIPSRPYLQLGLSKNVTYTYNEARAEGDRITSITINGNPIDLQRLYTIGTFSFLAQGGDNFWVFKDGTSTKDSGLVDRDAWIAYLKDHSPVTPSFARSGVQVSTWPTTVYTGEGFSVDVSRVNVPSLGAPENTHVTATWEGGSLRSPVSAGSAQIFDDSGRIAVTPSEAALGATRLVLVAEPSKTTITLPIDVKTNATPQPPVKKVEAKVTAKLSKSTVSYPSKASIKVTVTAKSVSPTGTVDVMLGKKKIASGKLVKRATGTSEVTVKLPRLDAGKHTLSVRYRGDKQVKEATSKTIKLTVKKQTAKVSAKVTNKGRTVTVRVSATKTPTGKVKVSVAGKKYTKKLSKGKVTFKISKPNKGKRTYTVTYLGDKNTAKKTTKVKFTVKK